MIKKILIIYLLFLSFIILGSEDAYGLKESYEVTVKLSGSDKTSIQEGMQGALKNLMITLTGSTKVASDRKLNKLYRSPDSYINQYKLISSDNTINARFFFEGNKIRNFLSDNQLPLWLSKESIVMTYVPCDLKSSVNFLDTVEKESCDVLKENLSSIAKQRLVELAYPILDFRDLNYLDSLSSVSYAKFMNNTIKRYGLDNWIVCFIRDDFGVILEEAICISSVSDNVTNLDKSLNTLINTINSKTSLIVNKLYKTDSRLYIEGISDYSTLEKVTEELRSQIVVTNLNLQVISKTSIEYELTTYGGIEDLEKLLNMNPNFVQLENSSTNRLLYRYLEI